MEHDGTCVKLGSKCGEFDITINFVKGSILPKCRPDQEGYAAAAIGTPSLKCSPGSVLSFTGNCKQQWVW